MKDTKIKFIRLSGWQWGAPMADIVYKSGRLVRLGEEDLPKTAKAFLKRAKTKCSFDKLWGFEIVYTI